MEKLLEGMQAIQIYLQEKAFENDILFISYHDQLTGIYNRRYLEEKLKEMDIKANYPYLLLWQI